MATLTREDKRQKRHLRIRRKIKGTAQRPRVCIYKSQRHLYAQAVDDVSSPQGSKSLLLLTTNSKEFKATGTTSFRNIETAKLLGSKFGSLLKEKGIEKAVFDRSGYPYHGIVKAFCEALREAGIKI